MKIETIVLIIGEHLYYIVERDQLWISWFDIGDFVQEHFGYHYISLGRL